MLQEYYGKVLKLKSDLKTNACVPCEKPMPRYMKKALADVHPDVIAK